MNRVVYLDNAATTAVDPRVIEAMRGCLGEEGDFANPSSVSHAPGRRARERIEAARAQVGALVGADPSCIVFTSGATESDNLAVLGAARFYRSRGKHVVTSRTEHPAVLAACRQLEREGFDVTFLKPGGEGIVEPAQVEEALRPDTILVSLMQVNNEIGVVHDVATVGKLCRARGILFHVDAAQSAGKLPIDVERDSIDLLAFTAHKMHGPKGAGALYVRREPRVGLVPLLFGGGQERGLRPGTLATHQVVGLGEACRIASAELTEDAARITALRERLWTGLSRLPGVMLNGDATRRAPGILSITIDGVEGESLLFALSGLAAASGSACATTNAEPSYVLRALGRSDRLAQSSLRLSLGRFTTADDIDVALRDIVAAVERLRAVAPWRVCT
jgi:cysteine desulfurase